MPESAETSLEELRELVEALGVSLSDPHLESLRSSYDTLMEKARSLGDINLGAGDLAVMYPPEWAPES